MTDIIPIIPIIDPLSDRTGTATVLLHFSLSVKAVPHACVIRTNPS